MWDLVLGFPMVGQPEISQGLLLKFLTLVHGGIRLTYLSAFNCIGYVLVQVHALM